MTRDRKGGLALRRADAGRGTRGLMGDGVVDSWKQIRLAGDSVNLISSAHLV